MGLAIKKVAILNGKLFGTVFEVSFLVIVKCKAKSGSIAMDYWNEITGMP